MIGPNFTRVSIKSLTFFIRLTCTKTDYVLPKKVFYTKMQKLKNKSGRLSSELVIYHDDSKTDILHQM